MKLYINNATNSLVTSATITTTPTITLFKEDISSVEIRFVENGLGVDIGTPTIRLALGKDGSLIALTEIWTKNGTGATAYWTGNFNLNTQQAEMVLAGLSSTEAILEVEVRQGGAVATKAQLPVTLKTDLINETDSATDIGNIFSVGGDHIASTTNVHGIANTTDLATKAYADGAGLKAGVQWTDRHTNSTGNPYLAGSIVYNAGRVYRCIADNDSMPTQEGGNPYWADLGVGYLLPNENPSILGGSINTQNRVYENETARATFTTTAGGGEAGSLPILQSFNGKNYYSDDDRFDIFYHMVSSGWVLTIDGVIVASASAGNQEYPWLAVWPNGTSVNKQLPRAGGSINTIGGGSINTYGELASGGHIDTHGEEVNGGYIATYASGSASGGNINTSAGGGSIYTQNFGGTIDTSGGGGRIQTNVKGYIELGSQGQRTDLRGTATSDRTIKLPDLSGTLALQGDAILRAVDFDLGKTTSPLTAQLFQLTGYEMKPYTDYMVADISVQIKSRYKTQPLTSNFYTIPALQAYPIENYVFQSSSIVALTAMGSPYTHPLVGSYVKIDNEYVLIDQVYDLVNGVRNIRVRRGQMGSSPNATHNAGGIFGIYESTVLFAIPPAVSVYNNFFGNAVSSDCSIGTRPLVGNFSRSQNTPVASIASGRQCLTYTDGGAINIQLTTLGTYLQTTSTSEITNTTTSIPVFPISSFSSANFYARITSTNGTEIVYVLSGGGGATWSVLRGVFGTTAIAHAAGAILSTNVGSNGTNALLGDIYVRLVPILR